MSFGEVTLAWDRNGEADLAGYRIYYGQSAVVLPFNVDVGLTATPLAPLRNLAAFQAYGTLFFGVKAYDATNNESAVSNIISTGVAPKLFPFTWP